MNTHKNENNLVLGVKEWEGYILIDHNYYIYKGQLKNIKGQWVPRGLGVLEKHGFWYYEKQYICDYLGIFSDCNEPAPDYGVYKFYTGQIFSGHGDFRDYSRPEIPILGVMTLKDGRKCAGLFDSIAEGRGWVVESDGSRRPAAWFRNDERPYNKWEDYETIYYFGGDPEGVDYEEALAAAAEGERVAQEAAKMAELAEKDPKAIRLSEKRRGFGGTKRLPDSEGS